LLTIFWVQVLGGYIPTSTQRVGQWHKIKVRINPPCGLTNLTVRAKEGYYTPH